jgi:hypothetical protein
MVPMRDGVRLSTDLYFPDGADGPLPTIQIRTPYDKNDYRQALTNPNHIVALFVGHGFVVATQDMRGKYESEGQFFLFGGNREDGYDCVDWLSKQPWSNGKVGSYGCSYVGENQLQLACERHPSHTCMIPQAAPGAADWFGWRIGGTVALADAVDWFPENGSTVHPHFPAGLDDETFARAIKAFYLNPRVPERGEAACWHLPIREILDQIGSAPTNYEEFIAKELDDPWWDRGGYIKPEDRIDTPALLMDSWYDYGVGLTLELFNRFRNEALSPSARDGQFVVIAPTTHCSYAAVSDNTFVGQRHVGDARFDYRGLYLCWFDYWLKAVDNGVLDRPKVQYFVMGANEWRSAEQWPLPGTAFTPWFLHSNGQANSRFGDGTLSLDPPGGEPADAFTYDPGTPVPSSGHTSGSGGTVTGAQDQSQIETRHDILVYTSEPLAEDLEITGPIEVVLYVSSSAKDTDFTAKLVDVHPDGTAYNLRDSILRARYRDGFGRRVWMEPETVYELRFSLGATSNVFLAGHRIQLDVSSSNFPAYDRNLNTGGNNYDEAEWVVARNIVHHSAEHSSHVLLPIVRSH